VCIPCIYVSTYVLPPACLCLSTGSNMDISIRHQQSEFRESLGELRVTVGHPICQATCGMGPPPAPFCTGNCVVFIFETYAPFVTVIKNQEEATCRPANCINLMITAVFYIRNLYGITSAQSSRIISF